MSTNVTSIVLVCIMLSTFIAAELVFKSAIKRKKDPTDVVLHLHDLGSIWMFFRDVIDGWWLSALGRRLVYFGASCGIAIVVINILGD